MARGLSNRARRGAIYTAIVAVTGVSSPVGAATFTAFWAQPVSGQWVDAANWTTADYPHNSGITTNYQVRIDAAGSPYTVSLDNAEVRIDGVQLSSANATLRVNGGSFSTGSCALELGASLEHQDGQINIGAATVASGATYRMSGGLTSIAQDLNVGFDGGQYIQTGGIVRQLQNGLHFVNVRSGAGTFIVDGPATRFESRGYLLSGFGTATSGTTIFRNGAFGTFEGGGVGLAHGTGTLLIESGAQLSTGVMKIGDGPFASSDNVMQGDGTVILSGASSKLTLSVALGTISVGTNTLGSGSGRLIINNGTLDGDFATLLIRATGGVELNGGTMLTSFWMQSGGTFIQRGGTLTAPAGNVQRGIASFSSGTSTLDSLAVDSTGLLNYTGGTMRTGSISLAGPMILSGGHDKVVQTTSLTITGAGKLDLADNDMIIDYSPAALSPIQSVRAYLQSGYNGGDWAGNGITSSSAAADHSRAIGYGENSVLNFSTFAGVSVDSSALLLTYAVAGDSNLDGKVDTADLGAIASNWQSSGMWTDGDFDYNGTVDVNDLGLLATNWQMGVTAAPTPTDGHPWAFADALASLGLPTPSVPEPMSAVMLAPLNLCMMRRPRRQHR